MIFNRQSRTLAKLRRRAQQVWTHQPALQFRSDSDLKGMGGALRERAMGGESLDSLLPEAYALVSEIAHRTLGQRPYHEQVMGAIALHDGMIVEMANGEGKTLTATFAAYLQSLSGEPVHIATFNDYLVKRDAQWMGPVYHGLGLSVGCIQEEEAYVYDPDWVSSDEGPANLRLVARRDAYACNITYATAMHLGFDYLRDNMVPSVNHMVLRDLGYIILDEADSALIDLSRTPLTVTAKSPLSPSLYQDLMALATTLRQEIDFRLDQQSRTVEITDEGVEQAGKILNIDHLYSVEHSGMAHQLLQSIRALYLYHRDEHYVILEGRVALVDEESGRLLPSNSFTDGLHQAIQAKEGLAITPESQTLAQISYQHFFQLYRRMAGMTATAKWREDEFRAVYNKPVIVIPPHRPVNRKDFQDLLYLNTGGKLRAIVADVERRNGTGQPVLVGTQTIAEAEAISTLLTYRSIAHEILTAKHHEREAEIIASGGRQGAVTVAAKMAGRGTDIVLEPGIGERGGLHVIGTHRALSRHLDQQLQGRAGRQGVPGSSRFFVSLEDELMRRFSGSDRTARIWHRLGMDEDVPVEEGFFTKLIEMAQRRAEEWAFKERQRAYEFDRILSKQRQFIYTIRRKAVLHEDLTNDVFIIMENVVTRAVEQHLANRAQSDWDVVGLAGYIRNLCPDIETTGFPDIAHQRVEDIKNWLINTLKAYREKWKTRFGDDVWPKVERHILLTIIDRAWADHLSRLETLADERVLRSRVEEDPLDWYVNWSNQAFWETLETIEEEFLSTLYRSQPVYSEPVHAQELASSRASDEVSHSTAGTGNGIGPAPRKAHQIGVNGPCPCGSGETYDDCHGAVGRGAAPADQPNSD